jgi:hypothetical protein
MQMPQDINTVMAVALPAAGILIWLVRLEGSVKRAHERYDDMKDVLSEIKDDVKDIKRSQERLRTFMGGGQAQP